MNLILFMRMIILFNMNKIMNQLNPKINRTKPKYSKYIINLFIKYYNFNRKLF